MILEIPLPSGWRVTLCPTSSGHPPGHIGGMTTASSELWCRLVGPNDWDSGWHRIQGSRSMVRAREWWELVECVKDLREAWLGTVGGPWPPPRYDETYFLGREWLDGHEPQHREERCPWCGRLAEIEPDGRIADHYEPDHWPRSGPCLGALRTAEERAAKRARGEGPE